MNSIGGKFSVLTVNVLVVSHKMDDIYTNIVLKVCTIITLMNVKVLSLLYECDNKIRNKHAYTFFVVPFTFMVQQPDMK